LARNAQAALEFLMTYGWAILVVLAAIGALAYFGVLSPEKFLPEKCTISPGIDCAGFDVRTTSAVFSLRNGMGKDLEVLGVSVGDKCCNGDITCNSTQTTITPTLPAPFPNGELINIQLGPDANCANGALGDRFRGNIVVRYKEKMTGIIKLTDGSVVGRIKE
jgi:hypothetical protein